MSDSIQHTDDPNNGVIVSVRGSVVDIHFRAQLPAIYSLLYASDRQVIIEVLAHLDAHSVRGIALTPTQGLARGMPVTNSGGPLQAPWAKAYADVCWMYSAIPSTAAPA